MLQYADLRLLHISLAIASLSGFALRWAWLMRGSPLFRHRLTSIVPHVLDTLFLASAIWLAITIRQYPFTHAWLTAKLFGLIAYIVLGSLALRDASTAGGRSTAFLAALVTFAWVVSVARLKSAWGFLLFAQ
jgi:uncharacterized membrane protein SirB2